MEQNMPDFAPRLALLVSQFNPDVTHGLRDGALGYLAEEGIAIAPADIHSAPGAFEIEASTDKNVDAQTFAIGAGYVYALETVLRALQQSH